MTRATPQAELLEAQFQQQVTDLAERLGYEWAHFRPAQTAHGWRTPVSGTMGKGWVDLILVRARDRRLLFVELKRRKGVLDPDQERVGRLLSALQTGSLQAPRVEWHCWRPADLDGAVLQALR